MSLPDVPEWADSVRLGFERDMLGFYISGHPLSDYAPIIRRFTNMDSRRLIELGATRKVRMAGLIRASKIRTTRAGKRMANLQIEDQEGTAEMTMFPNVFEQNATPCSTWRSPFLSRGTPRLADDGVQVIVQSIGLLSEVEKGQAQRIVLQIQPERRRASTASRRCGMFWQNTRGNVRFASPSGLRTGKSLSRRAGILSWRRRTS